MNARRLGCLSGAGLLAAACTLLLTVGVTILSGGRWFSPGPLHAQAGATELGGVRAHAETGGRCQACHTAPWERATLADRCLACHTAVAAELADPAALHGALKAAQTPRGCRACHTEHQGPAAALTRVDPATFPHAAVGYALTGHVTRAPGQPFTCADCHGEKLSAFDVGTCATCHQQADPAYVQAHIADFGAACLGCHDGVDRYSQATFDHQSVFPLAGKHTQAPCAGCHVAARTVADLRAAPDACVDCHREDDAHRGQLGADCAACHQPAGWLPAAFDHSKTAFPLTGQHAAVRCADCHANQVFKGTPDACVGCHADPVFHAGLFGPACEGCHTTQGWRPARFDQSHTFPFDHGQNGISPCRTCHPTQAQGYTCYGCHEHDPGRIERKHQEEGIGDFADCTRCHRTGQEEERSDDD